MSSVITTNKHNQIKIYLLIVLISLTILQQTPIIKEMYYLEVRGALYLLFGLFFAYSLFSINRIINNKFLLYFLFTLTYSLLLSINIIIFGNHADNIMLELLIPFGLLVCSINTDFNRKQLSGFLIWYIVLALVMGLSSIFYYGEGFTIKELYSVPSKNQIGPILGISTVIIGIWILNKNQLEFKFNSLFFKLSLFFLLLSTILVIRNRASLIAIIITLLFYLIREYKFKLTVGRVLLGPFLVIATILLFYYGTFNGLLDVFWKSITLNYDVNNLNSLSAGRTEVYALSIQFIMQNPFLGELTSIQPFQYTTPHNYILNKWVQYGIVGSLPYIIFYCFLWVYSIRGILIVKSLFSLAHWVLFFSLIVSIFEYTYPYGPGVSQLLVWFLLGQYLKETLKK